MALTQDQQQALAYLTVAYPAGWAVEDERAVEVYDQLVESGHAVRIDSDDFDGTGYQLSEEMAEANRRVAQQQADEADRN